MTIVTAAINNSLPLFTTHDGIDIYPYQEYWYFKMGFEDFMAITSQRASIDKNINCKTFSSKEAIEEYALLKQSVISIEDLLKWSNDDNEISNCKIEDLLTLVKSKIFIEKDSYMDPNNNSEELNYICQHPECDKDTPADFHIQFSRDFDDCKCTCNKHLVEMLPDYKVKIWRIKKASN